MTLIYTLMLLPLAGAAIALAIPANRQRPLILPLIAIPHLIISLFLIATDQCSSAGGWFLLDPLGKITLLATSTLFALCAIYANGYLTYRPKRDNRVLCVGLLTCLSAMSLVTVSQSLGLLWVAVEATTISMAPLIYFNRNPRSIEATWKYLLICSVGIALALLGLLFLAYSTHLAHQDATLLLSELLEDAPLLNRSWLHAATIFLLVGYGTKLGLAPLHTWKPDAYGEAPGLVGALLAGGLVSCAFLAILRVYQICLASGTELFFFQQMLIGFGLLSMAVAAVFMIRQHDFKRMLAYSSVEHVGILVIGLGIGKGALFGLLFHLINNGLTKGVLFLASGNIHRSYGGKTTDLVQGVLVRLPWSGGLFLAGFIAITGSPPFAPFVSEFTIISSIFAGGNYLIGSVFLLLLAVVFIGMAQTVLPMMFGTPTAGLEKKHYRDSWLTVGPPLLALLLMVWFGLSPPEPFLQLLRDGAAMLGGEP